MGTMGPSESVPKTVQPELRKEDMVTPAFPEPQPPDRPSASRLALHLCSEVPQNPSAPRGSSVGAAVLVIPACPSKPQQPLVIVEND